MIQKSAIAQTFLIPTNFKNGVFLTSVDLYFETKPLNETSPVRVSIVETLNGYPTDVEINNGGISIFGEDIIADSSSLKSTKFKFQNLVFLEPNIEYAIVVKSNSNNYKLWTSYLGDESIINPGLLISQQPAMGSLFKSQNSSTWSSEQLQDLTFKINYAKFDTNTIGNVTLNDNRTLSYDALPSNPFRITNGSTKVRVYHPNHGREIGMKISYEGSLATEFNGIFVVSDVLNSDVYTITLSVAATATDSVGGGEIKIEKNIKYDSIIIDGFESGKDVGVISRIKMSSQTSLDNRYTQIDDDILHDMKVSKYLHSSLNKSDILGSSSSLSLNLQLSSLDSAVSPIINLDTINATLLGNKVATSSVTKVDLDIDGETIATASTGVLGNKIYFPTPTSIVIPNTTDLTKIKKGSYIQILNGANDTIKGIISDIDDVNYILSIGGDSVVQTATGSISFTATDTINVSSAGTINIDNLNIGDTLKVFGGVNDKKTGIVTSIDRALQIITLTGVEYTIIAAVTGTIVNIKTSLDSLLTVASSGSAETTTNIIQYITYIDEFTDGGTAESKYLTKAVDMNESCTGFRVFLDTNIPREADFDMYYRTISNSSDVDIQDVDWSIFPVTYKKSGSENEFFNNEYTLIDLPSFDSFQFKIVMRSTNDAVTPKFKKFRIIAHV